MGKKLKIFEKMKNNPKGDWSISDVSTLCKQVGLHLVPPSRGSHYTVYSDYVKGALTVPHKRPIKPFYIKCLISLAEAHIAYEDASLKGSMDD